MMPAAQQYTSPDDVISARSHGIAVTPKGVLLVLSSQVLPLDQADVLNRDVRQRLD